MLREACAYAQAILTGGPNTVVIPEGWAAARASLAAVRLSSDPYGNDYFAPAPHGEPLGVALAVALWLALSAAVGRLREAAAKGRLKTPVTVRRRNAFVCGMVGNAERMKAAWRLHG